MSDTTLTIPLVLKMREAVLRLRELSGKAVVEKTDGEERQNLEQFLVQMFMTNASEFIGAHLTVQNEYAPIINAVATILNRATMATQARMQQAKAEKAGKIVSLDQ
jgi:hypothetical protein